MQKNLILVTTATIVFTISLFMFSDDGLIYLSAMLMAFAVIMGLRYLGAITMKVTRWAKAHARRAQVFITLLQVVILFIGLVVGYDLQQLGYKFSNVAAPVFASLMVIGFLSVHFFRKGSAIALPVNVFKDRLAYTVIIIAAYALAVIAGNGIEDKYPNSVVAEGLRAIDHKIFLQYEPTGNDQYSANEGINRTLRNELSLLPAFASLPVGEAVANEPPVSKEEAKTTVKLGKKVEKLERMKKRMMKRMERWRKAFAATSTAGTILLIFALIVLLCSGICLIVAGFSGGGAWPAILGVVLTGGAIWGFIELSKKNKKEKPNKQPSE